ncbi:uncharacterized protein LOC101738925 isoform X1 [Bombyx mori]|uniref:MADF domain-containing protein n=1 Tax=Bombyx mori TaxID=7091 RepID=A0A8R2C4W4_BOMMO|nr:uncharacterized protein LOC101738925 isoform X1 [Bombyx mori]
MPNEVMIKQEFDSDASMSPPVGRLVDCNQAEDRKMIRLVRDRPLLYARSNMPVASYYAQVKMLWQEVADDMGWSVPDVRRKWSHIRNSYSRHLRNEIHGARTGKGRMVSRWYLADELEFLKEHMATDVRRSSPYPTTYAPSYLEIDMAKKTAEDTLDPFIHNPWFTLATSRTKIEDREDSSSPHSVRTDAVGSTSQSFEADENSAYFQFFRGIHNDYQELPPKKQRLFRRQCLHFLHNLLDDSDGHDQSSAINLSNNADSNSSDTDINILPH